MAATAALAEMAARAPMAPMVQSRAMKTTRLRAIGRAAVAGIVLTSLAACGRSAKDVEADRAAIQQLLEAYLPALAEAYATGEVAGLEPYAAQKEVLSTLKRIRDLAGEGRQVRPRFKQLTLERVDVYQHSNAYVSTVETWDIEVYAAGSDRQLSAQPDQINRVRYQLKRTDHGWQILYRELVQPGPS
jgi:hypothetical protein